MEIKLDGVIKDNRKYMGGIVTLNYNCYIGLHGVLLKIAQKTSLLDVLSKIPGLRRYNSELHSGTLRRHPGNEIFQGRRANNFILAGSPD